MRLLTILPLIFLLSCGYANPYKSNKKNNDPKKDQLPLDEPAPGAGEPLNFSAQYWSEIFSKTELAELEEKEFVQILTKNIFETSISEDMDLQRLLQSSYAESKRIDTKVKEVEGIENAKACVDKAMHSVPDKTESSIKVTVDIGKCIPLGSAQSTGDEFKQYEWGYTLYSSVANSPKAAQALFNVQDALGIDAIFPFKNVRNLIDASSDVSQVWNTFFGKVMLMSVFQKKKNQLVRSWSYASLGTSEEKAFKVTYNPADKSIVVNGEALFMDAQVGQADSLKDFVGKQSVGVSTYYLFDNFTFLPPNPKARPAATNSAHFLGYSKSHILKGSYFIYINEIPFRMQALGQPCTLKAYAIQELDPYSENLLGTVNICNR